MSAHHFFDAMAGGKKLPHFVAAITYTPLAYDPSYVKLLMFSSRVKNDFNPRHFCWNFQSRQNSYEKAHCNFLKGSTTLLPPLMSANILRLTCNDNVRPNYFFFLQFLRARISSSCFLQSETVFLAMVWGHAMHSLELAAAAPRLEQSVCWVYSCLFSWPEALPGLGKRH